MALKDDENSYVGRRHKMVARWRYGGPVVIAITAALIGGLWWKSPLLINPFYVLTRIEAGDLTESGLLISAVMLPMLTIALLGLLIVLIVFVHVSFANEKRLLRIIARLNPGT